MKQHSTNPSRIHLTADQTKVMDCDAPAILVKAAAGTGKTEILARRAERFLQDASNEYAHVLAITYTTRGSSELQSRLQDQFGGPIPRLSCETIHGFANSILRQHGTHIGLPADYQVIAKDEDRTELFARFYLHRDAKGYQDLLWEIDLARAKLEYHPLLKLWQSALLNTGAVDYGEMLTKAIDLLKIPPVAHLYETLFGLVIVDEAQNLTPHQYQMLKALAAPNTDGAGPRIPIVLLGDPKQSIIRFAGADDALMDLFAHEFGALTFTLNQNFRSSKAVMSLAQSISQKLDGMDALRSSPGLEYPAPGNLSTKRCATEDSEGEHVAEWVDHLLRVGLPQKALASAESSRIEPEDIAVLARSRAALRATHEALQERACEIALAHSDDDFMATLPGEVSLLLMRTRSKPHRMTAIWDLRRKLGYPTLNGDSDSELEAALRSYDSQEYLEMLVPLLGATTPEEFVATVANSHLSNKAPDPLLAGWRTDQALIEEAWEDFKNSTMVANRSWTQFAFHLDMSQRGRDLGPGVRLMTIHKAQGREFKAVAIVGMNDGQLPDFRAKSDLEKATELQTFYVAVTRASRILLLTRGLKRETSYGSRYTKPSPYLRLIPSSVGGTR